MDDSALVNGVTVDYIEELTSATTSLDDGVTYLVSGAVNCNNLTINSGAVVKYKIGASLRVNYSVTCNTSVDGPAIFTAVQDDSVGDTMDGYPNSGYIQNGQIDSGGYADPAIDCAYMSYPTLKYLRIYYAQEGVRLDATQGSLGLWHSQLVNCIRGVVLSQSNGSSGSGSSGSGVVPLQAAINNVLFASVQSAFMYLYDGSGPAGSGYSGAKFTCCTFDTVTTLTYSGTLYNYPVFMEDSVFANVTTLNGYPYYVYLLGSYNGFYSSPQFGGVK